MTNSKISVVVPFFNERESLPELHRRLEEVLSSCTSSWEVLYIDDGSTDRGSEKLADACRDPRVRLLSFRRNYGKAAALDAGFAAATGDVVFTMDADLQDDPKEIPRFLAKLDEGFDLVSGWKKRRLDPMGKTLPSKLFNRTVRLLTGIPLNDFNCGFKAYRAEAIRGLKLYGEMHRFVPVLVHARGFRVGEIAVEHHARRFGQSKYGFKRLAKGMLDLLTVLLNTRYLGRPLHFFGVAGGVLGTLGLCILAYLTALWALGYGPIGTRPLLTLGVMLSTTGLQLFGVGLLGELVTRSWVESAPLYEFKGRSENVVRDIKFSKVSDSKPSHELGHTALS